MIPLRKSMSDADFTDFKTHAKCPWKHCAGGMGLAGHGRCSFAGDWQDNNCPRFITEEKFGEQEENEMNQGENAKAGREKYWSEIDLGTKSERMRKEIKRLRGEIVAMKKTIRFLFGHSHDGGKIMVSIEEADNRQWEKPTYYDDSDEVYF